MLRRLSAVAATALFLVAVTDPVGAIAAPTRVATATAPQLRVVPDTRAELRALPPAVHAAHAEEVAPTPDAEQTDAAPAPVAAPAPAAVWPVDPGTPITDGFGPREAPTAGASTNHRGIDFGAPAGTPVVAAASGTVTKVVGTDTGGCGIEVVIQHEENVGAVSTRYCHLLEGSPLVEVGATISAGDQIAAVGSTGVSTGAHLHFEVLLPSGDAVDPLSWLQEHATPAS